MYYHDKKRKLIYMEKEIDKHYHQILGFTNWQNISPSK